MNINKIILFSCGVIALFVLTFSCSPDENKEINLAGVWHFSVDSLDQGIRDQWYSKPIDADTIMLPGSMAENGKGNDVSLNTHWTGNMWNDSLWYTSPKYARYRQPGNIKVSFWLTPVKKYYGPAWYQKEITIPDSWKNQTISLELERPHWETIVWVDGQKAGMENRLGTPHHYDLTKYLTPGDHTLTIRVDNRVKDINPGLDAHSITDNTQTNWNGIVGDIKLKASPKVSLEHIKIYTDVANKEVKRRRAERSRSIKVKAKVKADKEVKGNKTAKVSLKAVGFGGNGHEGEEITREITLDENGSFEIDYPMSEDYLLWDEFEPNLYTMQVRLESDSGVDEKEVVFGIREFKTAGKQFSINGRPVFLRGTLECAIFPKTGYPPTDVESWKRIYQKIKEYGLNHMRFHSWCPPEAAFQAADEEGVYLQVEASAWATIGDGQPIDQWIYDEAEAIIDEYGNHPSFVMMAYGNEPSGDHQKEYLTAFISHMKKLDNRRLYTSGSGWPYLDNMDYYDNANPRIQHWAAGLKSIINAEPPQTDFDFSQDIQKTPMPYVSHEMGQWCVYPNFKEMSKYTGVLKPKNFEIFQEKLKENHMGHLADSFLLASGKLQVLCYKADIEAALRTKDMAGFQLLDLHDFPGQGTALVGVLDAFWDDKGYVTGEQYREFCSPTVPLVRLEKRIFSNNETMKVTVEIAHFGEIPLQGVTPEWHLTDVDGNVVEEGSLTTTDIPIGNGCQLGKITANLSEIDQPEKLTLTVNVDGNSNNWDIWVYPVGKPAVENAGAIRVVKKLNPSTLHFLESGGKVLLNINKGDVKPGKGGDIGVGFSSIFWNTSWTNGQKPHTLGILCDPDHPALEEFPTEYHSNWQWWDAINHSNVIILDDFATELKPIVRVIDDWFENRRTALIFEARVGQGKLLVSGVDLHTDLDQRLGAQQLLYSLKKYMAGNQFNPKVNLDKRDVLALFN